MTRLSVKSNEIEIAAVIGEYGDSITIITREEMADGVLRASDRAIVYPPELPGQQYRRTGILGRKTVSYFHGGSGVGVFGVESKAVQLGKHYSSYPLGDENGRGQALIHAGRWEVLRKAFDEELAVAVNNISNRLQDLANQLGIGRK